MAKDLILPGSKQLGKSFREDIETINSLKTDLENRIRAEARTSGEKVAAGQAAKWLVMSALGKVVLRWHPELREYEPVQGGRGDRQVGASYNSVATEIGRDRRMIARWLAWEKIVENNGLEAKVKQVIERWERFLLKDDWRVADPEIAEGPEPRLYLGRAEALSFLSDESVDIIITSPPYNLGSERWPMGGTIDPTTDGREERKGGIGYSDSMSEKDYQEWQVECLKELYRVAKDGASFFYNHKVRQNQGKIIHPMDWLRKSPWIIRQEIIWDRLSTHNHCAQLFWPTDERIYWLTKGKPRLPEKIGFPSVWRIFGPIPGTWHPAPFTIEIPRRCLEAIGLPGEVVLDPFGGSMTTCYAAQKMGYQSIGVDSNKAFLEQAQETFGWREKINE